MSSPVPILPRIRPGTNYVPTLATVKESVKEFKEAPEATEHSEVVEAKEEKVGGDPEPTQKKSWGRENMYIIIIFAIIVVALIMLIVWLVSKNDLPQMFRKPSTSPILQKGPKIESKPTHTKLVEQVSDAELDDYILDIRPTEEESLPAKPVGGAPLETIIEEPENSTPIDNSAVIEEELSKKIDDELQSIDIGETDVAEPSVEPPVVDSVAIDIDLEAQVADPNFKPIVQTTTKDVTLKVFNSKQELFNEGFDYDAVLKCANKEQDTHKKFKWKFTSSS